MKKIGKKGLKNRWKKDNNRVLQPQRLSHIPEIMRMKLINRHYDNLLSEHFDIKKSQELISKILLANTLREC